MSTSIKDDALRRCRDAYQMNRIPWDDALAYLPTEKLIETADYWERKHAESALHGGHELRTLRSLLSGLSGLNHGTGGGYLTPRMAEAKRFRSG